MSPNKHYEVLAAVEINGTLHDAGAVIELAEAEAAPFVAAGQLKEHGEGSAPAAPEGSVPPAAPQNEPGGASTVPEAPAAPQAPEAPGNAVPAAPEVPQAPEPAAKQEGWVGNHVPAGNEKNPHKGGSVTERHPDLVPKA